MTRIVKDFDAKAAGAAPFQFEDVRKMAKRILETATEQAKRKIMVAEAHAKEVEQAGYDDGFQQGEKEGFSKGETQGRAEGKRQAHAEFEEATKTVAPALQAILEDLRDRKVSLQAEAEADLLCLAMEIARRVVRRELSVQPDCVVDIARDAIALANERGDLVAHVHPDDLLVLEEQLPALREAFTDLGRVTILADPEMQRGGVRLSARDGEIDMRIEEQFKALERALVGEVQAPPPPPSFDAPAEVEPNVPDADEGDAPASTDA